MRDSGSTVACVFRTASYYLHTFSWVRPESTQIHIFVQYLSHVP